MQWGRQNLVLGMKDAPGRDRLEGMLPRRNTLYAVGAGRLGAPERENSLISWRVVLGRQKVGSLM